MSRKKHPLCRASVAFVRCVPRSEPGFSYLTNRNETTLNVPNTVPCSTSCSQSSASYCVPREACLKQAVPRQAVKAFNINDRNAAWCRVPFWSAPAASSCVAPRGVFDWRAVGHRSALDCLRGAAGRGKRGRHSRAVPLKAGSRGEGESGVLRNLRRHSIKISRSYRYEALSRAARQGYYYYCKLTAPCPCIHMRAADARKAPSIHLYRAAAPDHTALQWGGDRDKGARRT